MSERIATGEVGVNLNDRALLSGLKGAEAQVKNTMDSISRQRATAEVNVETRKVEQKIRETRALLEAYGREKATATADVDAKRAEATIGLINRQLDALNKRRIQLRSDASDLRAANQLLATTRARRVESDKLALAESKRPVQIAQETAEVARLQAAYGRLQQTVADLNRSRGNREQVRLDTGRALAEMELLRARLDALGARPIGVRVKIDRSLYEAVTGSENLGQSLGRLGRAPVRLGPFTTSVRALALGLTTLGPLLVSSAGGLLSIGSVLGSSVVGASALGVGALGGFGQAAFGVTAILKPMFAQVRQVTRAQTAYNDAVARYGEGSDRAQRRAAELTSVLAHVSPTARRAYRDLNAVRDTWSRLTSPAQSTFDKSFAATMKTFRALVPQFAKDSLSAFQKVGSSWDRFMGRVRRPENASAFHTMFANANSALAPLLGGLGNLGLYFARVGASASRYLKPLASTFQNFTERLLGGSSDKGALNRTIDGLVRDARTVGTTFMATGRVVKDFFNLGRGAGAGLLGDMTKTMDRWDKFINSDAGSSKIRDFFGNGADTLRALFGLIAPVTSSFLQLSIVMAPLANGFLKVATGITNIIGTLMKLPLASHGVQVLGMALGAYLVVGKVLAFAAAIERLGAALMVLRAGAGAAAALNVLRGVGGAGAGSALGGAALGAGGLLRGGSRGAASAEKGAAAAAGRFSTVEKGLLGANASAGVVTLGSRLAGLLPILRSVGPALTAVGVADVAFNETLGKTHGGESFLKLNQEMNPVLFGLGKLKDGFQSVFGGGYDFNKDLKSVSTSTDGMRDSFVRARGATQEVGTAFAQSRISLAQARRDLDGTRRGTLEYQQALLNYRGALNDVNQGEQAWSRARAASRQTAANEVTGIQTQIGMLKDLARNGDLTAAQSRRLADLEGNQLPAALNRQAAVVQNLQRQYRGMSSLVGEAEQAVGNLDRLGARGKSLATTISLKYEQPKDVASVANAASRALRAGVNSQIVVDVIAKTTSAKGALEAFKAIARGVPTSLVVEITSSANSERVRILALRAAMAGVPRSVITAIDSSAASEAAKVMAYRAILSGVPVSRVTDILADGALDSKQKVDALIGSINALQSKQVQVITNVITNHIDTYARKALGGLGALFATGRRAGMAQTAMVGEGKNPREYIIDRNTGRGYITNGPLLTDLSPDDYVIPTDKSFRGRATGLFSSLANELGIPGYASGRKPGSKNPTPATRAKAKHPAAPMYKFAAVPEDNVQKQYDGAKSRYEKVRRLSVAWDKRESAYGRAHKAWEHDSQVWHSKPHGRSATPPRPPRAPVLSHGERAAIQELKSGKLRREISTTANDLRAVRNANNTMANLSTRVDNLATRENTANANGDEAQWTRAHNDRLQLLYGRGGSTTSPMKGSLLWWYKNAQRLARGHYADTRETNVDETLGQVADERNATYDPYVAPAPDRPDAPTLEDYIQRLGLGGREDALLRADSDAQLTPDTADDRAAQGGLATFYHDLYGQLKDVGASTAILGEAAGNYRSAYEASLAPDSAGSSSSTSDQQARIDQLSSQLQVARTESAINAGFAQVAGGPGDIGTGGWNSGRAGGSSGPNITIQTLHPGDPATLAAVANAATSGMGNQGYRSSSVQRTGL
jgi:hypothetical protein